MLVKTKSPFLKNLGTILTGLEDSSFRIEQSLVRASPPEPAQVSISCFVCNRTEERVFKITHKIVRDIFSEQEMDHFYRNRKEKVSYTETISF